MAVRLASFALSLLLLLLSGCTLFGGGFLEPGIDTVEEVESFVGVKLPETAAGVEYEVQGFTDLHIRLRFEAPADEVAQYFTALGIELAHTTEVPTASPTNEFAWWQPETATLLAQGELDSFETNRFYRAWVDQSGPEKWIVYLVAFSM